MTDRLFSTKSGKLMKTWASRFSLTIVASIAVAAGLLLGAFELWSHWGAMGPRFDVVIEVDAPRRLGCFEAFINGTFDKSTVACLDHDGQNELLLRNVSASIKTLRLDTGDPVADTEFTIRSIKFRTSISYVADPDRVIREFGPREIATWSQSDVKVDGETGRSITLGRDPMLQTALNLDLPSQLGPPPNKGTLVLRQGVLLTLGMMVVGVGCAAFLTILLWKEYHRTTVDQRHAGLLVAIAGIGFVLTVMSAFPAHTNFDEMYSLSEIWLGRLSDVHPPLQVVVWSVLMDLGRAVGLPEMWQVALMLIVQSALLWWAAVIMASWIKTRWLACAFLLLLAISPISMVYFGHIGKDSQLAVALLVAIACIGLSWRRRSLPVLAVAVLPLFYGFAVRSNAPPAVLPLCLFWVIALFGIRGVDLQTYGRKAAAVSLASVLFLGLWGANYAFSNAVVKNRCCLGHSAYVGLIYDLMGISVRVDRNLLPPAIIAEPGYDLETVKKRYDPIYVVMSGFAIIGPDLGKVVLKSWFAAITQYPRAFLSHRIAVLSYMFGLHAGPAPFPYMSRFFTGLPQIPFPLPAREKELLAVYRNQSPEFFAWRESFENYFARTSGWPIYKIWPYFVFTAIVFAFPALRGRVATDPAVWLCMSAIGYALPYVPIGSAAQFRYFWWTALALFCALVIRLDAVLEYLRSGNQNSAGSVSSA
jgi:hypothetical protein